MLEGLAHLGHGLHGLFNLIENLSANPVGTVLFIVGALVVWFIWHALSQPPPAPYTEPVSTQSRREIPERRASGSLELTGANFEATVVSGVTLLCFGAEWCMPSRMMMPALDALAAEYEGRARIAKVNVDNEGDLGKRFDVSVIPFFVVIRDGVKVSQFMGVTRTPDLKTAIDSALSVDGKSPGQMNQQE